MSQEGFLNMSQPGFNAPEFPGSQVTGMVVDNSGDDPLSIAARLPVHAPLALEKPKPAPFILEYSLHGQPIRESHISVKHALSSVRRLRSLGITPQTSTDRKAYAEMMGQKA